MISLLMITGCGDIQIFEDPDAKYELVPYSDTQLSMDQYYVKEGTKFYMPYKADGKAKGATIQPDSFTRVVWLNRDASLIPTLYENELIAYASESTEIDAPYIERFKDIGYSIGAYNAQKSQDGIILDGKSNVVSDSYFGSIVEKCKSDNIRIVEIGGVNANEYTLSDSGVILGLEKNQDYLVKFYAGTYYNEATITADMWFLESFETMPIENYFTTKNGYIALKMPELSKPGYYNIGGQGLYRYYDFEKDSIKSDVDMNEPFYEDLAAQLSAYTQQFVVSVKERTVNLTIDVLVKDSLIDQEDAYAILSAPNGVTYDLKKDEKENLFSVKIAEAVAGTWHLNVYPKTLEIAKIDTDSETPKADAFEETSNFTLSEDDISMVFQAILSCDGTGTGECWGIVEYEDGTIYNFEKASSGKSSVTLACPMPYAKAGSYTVTIFHYNDSVLQTVDFVHSEDYQDVDIITVIDSEEDDAD